MTGLLSMKGRPNLPNKEGGEIIRVNIIEKFMNEYDARLNWVMNRITVNGEPFVPNNSQKKIMRDKNRERCYITEERASGITTLICIEAIADILYEGLEEVLIVTHGHWASDMMIRQLTDILIESGVDFRPSISSLTKQVRLDNKSNIRIISHSDIHVVRGITFDSIYTDTLGEATDVFMDAIMHFSLNDNKRTILGTVNK